MDGAHGFRLTGEGAEAVSIGIGGDVLDAALKDVTNGQRAICDADGRLAFDGGGGFHHDAPPKPESCAMVAACQRVMR
jgi:hypothetical protein